MLPKIPLSIDQVQEIVMENKVKVSNETAGLVLPVKMNFIDMLTKTAEIYGFEIDPKKADASIKTLSLPQATILEDTSPGALLQIQGDYSTAPQFSLETHEGLLQAGVYIFHETLMNKNNRLLAHSLLKDKSVSLFPGTDEEYLYEIFAQVVADLVVEEVKKAYSGLPFYFVQFADDGNFTMKDYGIIGTALV